MRAEAVGDFAEDDAGTQRLFRAVVGRRYVPVGDEDEQVLAKALDDPEQLQPLPADGLDPEQPVERCFQPGRIGGEGGGLEPATTAADGDGLLQQVLDGRCESGIAGVDGILNIAQEMRLMPTSA